MDIRPTQKKLPVLLLYNLDPTWAKEDIDDSMESAQILIDALRGEGHMVTEVRLENQDLPEIPPTPEAPRAPEDGNESARRQIPHYERAAFSPNNGVGWRRSSMIL